MKNGFPKTVLMQLIESFKYTWVWAERLGLHWSVVRRNKIGGISQVALSINRTVPKCGGIRVTCAMGGYPGLMASTDVIVERNQFDCPSPGVTVGTVVDPSCSHCVQKSSKE